MSIVFTTHSYSQSYRVEVQQLGVAEGLLHREVNVIHQDKMGFVWIGTPLGLNRYDGHRIKWYTQRSHSFQTNQFGHVAEDSEGRLWLFGTNETNIQSIDILDSQADSSVRFDQAFPDFTLFEVDDLRAICLEAPNGNLVFQHAESGHLYWYSIDNGFKEISLPQTPDFVLILLSPTGTLWGHTDSRTWVEIDQAGKLLQKVEFAHDMISARLPESSALGFYLYAMEEDQCIGTTFIDWHGQATQLGEAEWFHMVYSGPNLSFISILLADQTLPHKDFRPDSSIWHQLIDQLGKVEGGFMRAFEVGGNQMVWTGGNFGAYQLKLRRIPFRNYFAPPYDSKGRSERWAGRGLLVHDHFLIANLEPFTTQKIDIQTGQFQPLDKGACNSWNTNGISPWADGQLLVGTNQCLLRVDEQFEVVQQWQWQEGKDIWAIYPESPEKIWLGFGHGKGIGWLNPLTGVTVDASNDPVLKPLLGKNVLHIASDLAGRIWLCTNDGLYLYKEKEKRFAYFGEKGEGHNYLPAKDFLHFYQDPDSIFWVATKGNGLLRWDQQKDLWRQLTREDGLPNNTVYGVYEDDHNHLWLPSDYGIIQLDKQTFVSKTYLPKDGTSEFEFNRISHTQAPDGTLFFGSINGITSFHPNDFYTNDSIRNPTLAITGYEKFDSDQKLLGDYYPELMAHNTVRMMPNDRYVKIDLALLNFDEIVLNQYLWKIEGLEDDWHVQNEPSITLERIPYGNYTLRIKARTAKGLTSANSLEMPLRVVPPFYKTNAFTISAILVIVGLIGLFFYLRIRSLRRTQKRLEQKVAEATEELREMDRLKTRLFANVSHELRTPLSLILGPISTVIKNFKLEQQATNYLELARRNGRSLQLLITEILDLGKLESGKLKLEETPFDFSAFIDKTAFSFQALAESEKLEFHFETNLQDNSHLFGDKRMIERIVNNLLSNAIKFTPEKGEVRLSVRVFERSNVEGNKPSNARTLEHSNLFIAVSDSGPGIHPDDLPYIFDRYYQAQKGEEKLTGGTGIGLALSKELAELMGGSLIAESTLGAGSQFTLTLPWKAAEAPITEMAEAAQSVQQVAHAPLIASNGSPSKESKETLLIVEDNADLRAYLQSLLEGRYHVLTARHGREALEVLGSKLDVLSNNPEPKTQNIKLVLTDLMMPEMDGMALLEAIKADNKFRQLPVIMLTARTGLSERLQALRLGVHDYLTKPFEEEELLVRIENLLAWAKSREEAQAENPENGEPIAPTYEDQWLEEVNAWVSKHYQSPETKMMDWADSLHLSESQFRRRLKKATGLSPQQYLQEYRLTAARQLLEGQSFATVSEIAHQIGFAHSSYFSTVFQKRFGKAPSAYLKAS